MSGRYRLQNTSHDDGALVVAYFIADLAPKMQALRKNNPLSNWLTMWDLLELQYVCEWRQKFGKPAAHHMHTAYSHRLPGLKR